MAGAQKRFIDQYSDIAHNNGPRIWRDLSSLEEVDQMVSNGDSNLHPAVEKAFEDVLKKPGSFGVSVEENNLFEEMLLHQGEHDFSSTINSPTSMLGGVRG